MGKNLKKLKPKSSSSASHPAKKLNVRNIAEILGKSSDNLLFSFQFFDRFSEKCFNLGGASSVCDNWFVSLLDVMKELSERTWSESCLDNARFNIHPHDFTKTNFKYKIFDDATLEQLDCCQFQLSKSKGRVHGFKIDNIFYVYWLDPNHSMYDVEGFEPHTKYKHKPLPDCLEKMNEMNFGLLQENRNLKQENKDFFEEICRLDEENKELQKEIS